MSESLEHNKKRGPDTTRRQFLLGGASAAGAALTAPGAAKAGLLQDIVTSVSDWWTGREELEGKFHATHVYLGYAGGQLARNFEELREVAAHMKKERQEYIQLAQRGLETELEGKRKQYDRDIDPIVREKNDLLARFDPVLIPQLLTAYLTHNIRDKNLVVIYQELGGDLDAIQKKGVEGVDGKIAGRIKSVLWYTVGRNQWEDDFGEARYGALEFYKKKENEK